MISRVTTFTMKPGGIDAFGQIAEEKIKPALSGLAGMISITATINEESNSGVVVAVYENRESMDAATATASGVWAELADMLAGPPTMEEHQVMLSM